MKYLIHFEHTHLASPAISTFSTHSFSTRPQPTHSKPLPHSFKNIGGIPPKSEFQAKPNSRSGKCSPSFSRITIEGTNTAPTSGQPQTVTNPTAPLIKAQNVSRHYHLGDSTIPAVNR